MEPELIRQKFRCWVKTFTDTRTSNSKMTDRFRLGMQHLVGIKHHMGLPKLGTGGLTVPYKDWVSPVAFLAVSADGKTVDEEQKGGGEDHRLPRVSWAVSASTALGHHCTPSPGHSRVEEAAAAEADDIFGEVTGNSGNSRGGCASLGVVLGDGCR
ncbi:hypothetical protein MUK42_37585 [Musa troglodytarum]|uniref:Uncharacterized protein n=1 Tax=Musa troglodytarum TaxID=320322 RepID=A0A9E7JYV3_9LILI|nr:hypothetical protein MUK42_37585 [Musa troglodytarum]